MEESAVETGWLSFDVLFLYIPGEEDSQVYIVDSNFLSFQHTRQIIAFYV